MSKGLLILGFGGHGRSVANTALNLGFDSLLFIDKNAKDHEKFLGFPVHHVFEGPLPEGWLCIPASGDNKERRNQMTFILNSRWPLATLISPHAVIGQKAVIAPGCFIGPQAYIGPMAKIGKGSIINTGAIVEHDCVIGDYAHVSINASVAGRSRLGNFVFLGAGATAIDGITINNNITIGAGGVVTTSLRTPGTYIGVPAKLTTDSSE